MLEDFIKLDEDKMVQKVLNFSDVKTRDFDYPLYCSEKFDGCFCLAVKENGIIHILSRTGKPYTSLKHIEEELTTILEEGQAVIFEAYNPNIIQSEISGFCRDTLNQHEEVFAYIHTYLTLKGNKLRGSLTTEHKPEFLAKDFKYLRFVEFIKINNIDNAVRYASELISLGKEGLILRQNGHPYIQGDRNNSMFRIKEKVTFDLEVLDIFEAREGQFAGMMGGVICRFKDDKQIRVGSGFTKEHRQEFLKDPSKIVGKIIEVEAMKQSSKGDLREARFKSIRTDKSKGDF